MLRTAGPIPAGVPSANISMLPSSDLRSGNTRFWSCLLQHARHLTLQLKAGRDAGVAKMPNGTSHHGTSHFRTI